MHYFRVNLGPKITSNCNIFHSFSLLQFQPKFHFFRHWFPFFFFFVFCWVMSLLFPGTHASVASSFSSLFYFVHFVPETLAIICPFITRHFSTQNIAKIHEFLIFRSSENPLPWGVETNKKKTTKKTRDVFLCPYEHIHHSRNWPNLWKLFLSVCLYLPMFYSN